MPVDVGSYPSTFPQPTQVNPLQLMSGVAGLQNTLNQNKLFSQQYQTNLGLGQIYKSAIDPNTGQLDTSKLNALISQNPNVTMALPQAIQNSQEAQKNQIGIQTQQLALAKQHLDTLESYVAPLAANPNVSSKDVIGAMSQAMSMGHVDPSTASQLYASIPRGPNGQIDESQVPGWLKQQQFRMLDLKQQFDAQNPTPTIVNNGPTQAPFRFPQVGPVTQAGPPIQNSFAPGQTAMGPDNRPHLIMPTGGQLPANPGPTAAPAVSSTIPGTTAQTQPSPLAGSMSGLNGAANAAPQQAPQTAPTSAQPANSAAPTLGPATGLGPGVAEAATTQANASAQQGVALQQAADQIPAQKAILANLGSALNNFTAGPGADWRKVASAFANTPLQALGLKGVGTASIASQEEFDKLATNLAQSQFATLGGTGTDAKLDSAMHTSPNSALSKLGNQNIMALLKGNADAIAVKNQEWQKYQQANGPQSYGQFSTQFNKSYSPRVFQSQYMTPQDRTAMVKDMSKPELNQFRLDYNLAVHNGWIPDPRQPNAGQ